MPDHRFPQHTRSKKTGILGMHLVTSLIEGKFGWVLRKTDQQDDYGIDAFADIVTPGGDVTGRSLAIQVKTGDSYFTARDDEGFYLQGEMRHLNLYSNYALPVILVVCNSEASEAWWIRFERDATEQSVEGWRIFIPWKNKLSTESKTQFEQIAGPAWDYTDDTQFEWAMSATLKKAKLIHFVVDKEEVVSLEIDRTVAFFHRLTKQTDVRRHMQGRLMITFYGYEDDPRELWQIPEMRMWMKTAEPAVKYWLYFVCLKHRVPTMFVLRSCVCAIRKTGFYDGGKKVLSETPPHEKKAFMLRHYGWLNEFCEKYSVGEEKNREISALFATYWDGFEANLDPV